MAATTTSEVHVQRDGLYVRRSEHAEFDHLHGVPVLSAPLTLLELARDLSLLDLVPMVDCALADGTEPEAVLAVARPRVPGVRRLRRALTLADERSESWWESILRLMHVLTRLGPVDSQVELFDAGRFVARVDLHLVGTIRYPECDGGRHRDADRHNQDLRREKAISRLGGERYGYTTQEMLRNPQMIIRDAEIARALPHEPERVRTWWRWATESTLTAPGRRRLDRRLARYRRAATRRRSAAGGG